MNPNKLWCRFNNIFIKIFSDTHRSSYYINYNNL